MLFTFDGAGHAIFQRFRALAQDEPPIVPMGASCRKG
jgi:hypothetical protein